MNTASKPRHDILQDLTVVLYKRNPMNLSLDSSLEYENEALSILSRFSESAIEIPTDEALVAQVAVGIVKQTLEFWFDQVFSDRDIEPLARELLATYREGLGIKPDPVIPEGFVTGPADVIIGG